jgi:predicted membrane protein
MDTHNKSNKRNVSWMGVALILIGLLIIGKYAGVLPTYLIDFSFGFIVGILIAIWGVYTLFQRHYLSGFWILALSVGYLIHSHLPESDTPVEPYYWSGVLILFGVLLMIRKRLPQHAAFDNPFVSFKVGYGDGGEECVAADADETTDGFVRISNEFSGTQRSVVDTEFIGGRIDSLCGGVTLDLRRAILPKGTTYIDVSLRLSGLELYAPSHWRIKYEGHNFAGGYEDKRLTTPSDADQTLVLRGELQMSGITVKS